MLKQNFTAAFFVAADGSKVTEPVVVQKSKSPRCFKNTQNKVKTKYRALLLEQQSIDPNG